MNKFFGYALMVTIFSTGTSWVKMINEPSSGGSGSSWSRSSGSWGGGSGYGGGGGGHK